MSSNVLVKHDCGVCMAYPPRPFFNRDNRSSLVGLSFHGSSVHLCTKPNATDFVSSNVIVHCTALSFCMSVGSSPGHGTCVLEQDT